MLQAAVLAPSHLRKPLYVFLSVCKLGIPWGQGSCVHPSVYTSILISILTLSHSNAAWSLSLSLRSGAEGACTRTHAALKVVQQLHFVRCLPGLLLSSTYSEPGADLFFRAQLSLVCYIFTQYTALLTKECSKNSLWCIQSNMWYFQLAHLP